MEQITYAGTADTVTSLENLLYVLSYGAGSYVGSSPFQHPGPPRFWERVGVWTWTASPWLWLVGRRGDSRRSSNPSRSIQHFALQSGSLAQPHSMCSRWNIELPHVQMGTASIAVSLPTQRTSDTLRQLQTTYQSPQCVLPPLWSFSIRDTAFGTHMRELPPRKSARRQLLHQLWR